MARTAVLVAGWLVAVLAAARPIPAQTPGEFAAELDRLLASVAAAPADREPVERARRLEQLGDVEMRAGMLTAARAAFEEAVALRERAAAPADADLGRLSLKLAAVARLDQRPADAEQWTELAVTRLRAGAPDSDEYLDALVEMARAAAARQDYARADAAYANALAVVSARHPGSPREAHVLEQQGDLAVRRQDLEAADRYYARALAVLEAAHRSSADYARLANALAVVAAARSQPARARQLYDTAIAIYEAQRPESLELAQALANLAVLLMTRGEHAAAETLFRRALALKTARRAPPADVGATRANLALVLAEEGRPAEAAAEFKAAVELRRPEAPPLDLTALLLNLARAERVRGNAEAAAAAAREALDLGRAHAPGTPLAAEAAIELGLVREQAKALDEAAALYREALAIREKAAPGSSDVAQALERLAAVAAAAGDVLAARNAFERAADAWGRAAPGSLEHAHIVHALGRFLVEHGETDEGLRRLREAVSLLEKAPPAPASPTRAWARRAGDEGLVSRLQAYYGTVIRLLADRGDAGEALTLLDRMHEQLRRARCGDCGPATTLAPVEALRRGIEAGTLVVAFSVQPAATYAFVGRREAPVRVYRIDVTAEALAERVHRFVDRVRAQVSAAIYESPVVADGRALYESLFGQFDEEIRRADRLLIVPDGPLELVPFSAVARPTSRVSWQYLADWKPLAYAPSVGLAAAWAAGVSPAATVSELLPGAEPGATSAAVVGPAPGGGAIVALWPPPEDTTVQLLELFATAASPARSREWALAQAQRILRTARGRAHPIYWAAFRYYGPRGVR